MADLSPPLAVLNLPVDDVKVAEFARAIRWHRPGVPPMFTAVSAHHTEPGGSPNELIIAAACLEQRRVLLGSTCWRVSRPIDRGDRLIGAVSLLGCVTKTSRSGAELKIASGSTAWRDQVGEPVVEVFTTLIETPPAPLTDEVAAPGAALPTPIGEADLILSRTDIVRYAGASGDFNPMHHDQKAAQLLGYPDVFAMGMLPGSILAGQAAQRLGDLDDVAFRFRGLVWPDVPYRVEESAQAESRRHLRLQLIDPVGRVVLEVDAAYGGPA